MKKEIKKFIKICKKDQNKLKAGLVSTLKNFGYTPIVEDGFILAVGSKIMLTAHMDTVHNECVKNVVIEKQYNTVTNENETIISSPQGIGGDDRCGIYMILSLLEKGYRPTVLFCEDEEDGGVGSGKFIKTEHKTILSDMLYLLELDRKGSIDAVYYDCGNKDFQEYVEKFGFVKDYGSFSDIGHLSPEGDVASVNLSCGYYKQHTLKEYVIFEQMLKTIDKVAKMLDDEENVGEKFDYQEILNRSWYGNYGSYGGGYGYLYDDCDYYNSYYRRQLQNVYYVIWYSNENKVLTTVECFAVSREEAIGQFMSEHPDMTYNDIVDCCDEDTFYDFYEYGEVEYAGVEEEDMDVNEYICEQLEDTMVSTHTGFSFA